jgi:phospholipase/carboxylesterase
VEEEYPARVAQLGGATLVALSALEVAERRLHPPEFPELRRALSLSRERLERALEAFRAAQPDDAALRDFHEHFAAGATLTLEALARFVDPGPPHEAAMRILGALGSHRRAQAVLYPRREVWPAIGRWVLEAPLREADSARSRAISESAPRRDFEVGHFEAPAAQADRGGFSLYVPEWWDGASPWPLVVALHGGSGHGREFLWTWLREARSRGFVLLSPTSLGPTWSLDAPGVDAARLASMVDFVAARWPIDRTRVLLTGLSDGATFTLLAGLLEGAPYAALAPVSGVLHPMSFGLGNLGRAAGRRIYQVHGALDWLFPVALARLARDELQRAGAALVYREIEDLSHTYPREENAAILEWFDPALRLP